MSFTFDPDIAAALAPMAGFTPPAVGDVAARRAVWEPIIGAAGTAQPIPGDVTTSEHHATADDGAPVKMRWYVKKGADGDAPGPAVLFFHGGGYIFGHIDLFDGPVSRYVSASGVPMLSVEYRRAPEHPFPTPLEDAYAALRWLHDHAAELGVDPDRIGVMGDSAGGGLAAALTILGRERGGPKIARQILLMPMLDDRTRTPDPYIAPYALWSYDDSATAWPALLGEAAGGPDVPATAAPARLEDATGLPPAYIEVGQIDVFRDEDTAYATKLMPSSGDELQSEYFVPRDRAYEAILAVEKLRDHVTPHLLISELRTIDADDLWMSPCYRRPAMTIHFTWKPEWPAVKRVLPMIEEQLTPFDPRPHWAKLFTMAPDRLQSRYKKLSDYRALVQHYDPAGKARNEFLNHNIFAGS